MNQYRYVPGRAASPGYAAGPGISPGNPYSALLGSVGCMPGMARAISPDLYARTTPTQSGPTAGAGATTGAISDPGGLWPAITMASAAASAYHGYARNRSILWAGVWGLLGYAFPIITPAVAVAQGFGERE